MVLCTIKFSKIWGRGSIICSQYTTGYSFLTAKHAIQCMSHNLFELFIAAVKLGFLAETI